MRIAAALAAGFYLGYRTHKVVAYVMSGQFTKDLEAGLQQAFPDERIITTYTQG